MRSTRIWSCSSLQNEAYSNYRVKRMNLDGLMSIGDLSKEAGVKVVTIRYYEQIKLMPAPPRTEANYRAYKLEHLHRLRFIHRCRSFGFTLDQVRDFLRLSTQPKQKCSEVDRITANHLKEIERKVADLRRLATELRRIQRRCPGKSLIGNCRILEALSPAPNRPGLKRGRSAHC
jgi:DNA-binding transcriptional MerR regulator